MASNSGTRILAAAAVTVTLCLLLQGVYCTEFDVGERYGWAVPPQNGTTDFYNNWASKKRFKLNDTIRFVYKKGSVMSVSKRDYKECNSTRPDFFSNTGNTAYTLDRSGFFFFISGATGHCEMGQRMIVWVVAQDATGGTSPQLFPSGFLLLIILLLLSNFFFN